MTVKNSINKIQNIYRARLRHNILSKRKFTLFEKKYCSLPYYVQILSYDFLAVRKGNNLSGISRAIQDHIVVRHRETSSTVYPNYKQPNNKPLSTTSPMLLFHSVPHHPHSNFLSLPLSHSLYHSLPLSLSYMRYKTPIFLSVQ